MELSDLTSLDTHSGFLHERRRLISG
jgi:hypothetical protein